MSEIAHAGAGRFRGRSGFLDWLLVRDRVDRGWVDSLGTADLDWLLTTIQTRSAVLSAQAAAAVAPLGIGAAALAATVKYGVPPWVSIPTVVCLAIAGAHLALAISRAHARLLTLERPLERAELLKDESAAVHEKALLLQRAVFWLLVSVIGVVAAAVIAIE
jgi:hypothetical protein